jgi:hypothetical protein
MANVKAHTQYKLKSGTLVPGVTTVLNLLDKPFLVAWAYNCGCKGIDYRKVRDTGANIGSLVHYLILCDLKNETPDTTDYSQADIEKANNSLKSYYAWKKQNPIKPIMVETALISEKFGYGGTMDLFAQNHDSNILYDFKTSGGIYVSYLYQLAAYGQLILENTGKLPDMFTILRFNKDNNSDFEIRYITDMSKYFEVFRHLLCIYNLQKELGV